MLKYKYEIRKHWWRVDWDLLTNDTWFFKFIKAFYRFRRYKPLEITISIYTSSNKTGIYKYYFFKTFIYE